MRYWLVLFIFIQLSRASAQPKLIVSPAIQSTPLGFARAKSQLFIRDPYNIKLFDWEQAALTTLQLAGMQISQTSRDGMFTAFGNFADGFEILLINNKSGAVKTFKGSHDLMGLHISPDNQYLAAESEEKVTVFSINQENQAKVYQKKMEEHVSCSFNDKSLLVRNKKLLEVLSLPDLKVVETIPIQGDFLKFINAGQFYSVVFNGELLIYDSNTKKLHIKIKEGLPSAPFPYDNTPLISPDGKSIAIFQNLGTYKLLVYELEGGKELLQKDLSQDIGDIMSAMFFQVDPQWRFFAIANKSNGVTLFDLKTGEEKCQIYSIGLDDILIKIPNGYYMATRRGAFDGVNFEYEGQIFDFDQFDVQFNRPDLVLEYIGLSTPATIAAFKKAHEKRLKELKVTQEPVNNAFQTPTIEWVKDLPVFTDNTQIEVAVSAKSEHSFLQHLNVYVNGVPLYGKKGHRIKDKKAKSYLHQLKLNLTPGDNRIEVEALDQANRISLRLQTTVRCEAPEVKPTLHIVTIGVSHYADSSQNLIYAGIDALKVEELFKGKNSLYPRVVSYPLWEADFTKQSLEKVRKSLLQTKESDHVIIFYAGHGIPYTATYYLGSTQTNFTNPAQNGIPYSLVESLLDSIPARKRLIMLDACFSGKLDEENAQQIKLENTVRGSVRVRSSGVGLLPEDTESERVFNLMREWFIDLSPSIGATILSATSGMQEAEEDKKWKNGAFTWCLLQGLRDKQADRDKDNKIMLSELRDYLESTVPVQTDRKQQPSFRSENLVTDWQIW